MWICSGCRGWPIGLLAALSVKQLGLDVHVLDKSETGAKPDLVRALGASYHFGSVSDIPFEPQAIIECTGNAQAGGQFRNVLEKTT